MNPPLVRPQGFGPKLSSELPGRAGPATDDPGLSCFRTSEHAAGVKLVAAGTTFAFPYSHFLFAELCQPEIFAIRFVTHHVTVSGRNLEILLDEMNSHRLTVVQARPRPKRETGSGNGAWVDRIDVTEAKNWRKTLDTPPAKGGGE